MAGERVRVAWLSRHPPLPAQLRDLERAYGPVEVVQVARSFSSAEEVVEEVRRLGARVALAVLPLSMLSEAVRRGREVVWLWAEMERLHVCPRLESCPDYDPERDVGLPARGGVRHLRYRGLHVLKGVELVLEPLEPAGGALFNPPAAALNRGGSR